MRDLEIRGAGNILGVHQHGFIAAVGFELYCRLLEEAVKELRGEKPEPAQDREIMLDIPLEAYIPNEYVEDGAARISVYQELSGAASTADVDEAERSLADRFGPMPQSVLSLLALLRIKVLARGLGCVKVSVSPDGRLALSFEGDDAQVREAIGRIVSKSQRKFDIVNGTPAMLRTQLEAKSMDDMALQTEDLLAVPA